MQKLLFKILFAILLLAAGISAQAANVIVMVTAKSVGDTINLDITANGSYTVSGANSVGGYSYTLTSDTVTITGDVTEFHCDKDSLTALDVSHNTTLGMLYCTGNRLTALDVSLNTTLGALYCNDNRLTALDVSKNVLLDVLNCSYNSLDSLDVSHNTALGVLDCHGDSLTALDVSHNTELLMLDCHGNRLTALDVSHNTSLILFDCFNNRLTALDVSHNTALSYLDCNSNSLTALDVSKNVLLNGLICSYNSLDSLNVSLNTSLFLLSCYNNSIRDAQMDTLVNTLVNRTGTTEGTFIVIDTRGDNNVCTTAQVDVARAKNWNVKSADGNDYGGSPRTGIEGITGDTNVTIVGIYDLRGIRLARLQPGFNIIKLSNGTAKKVFIKE